MVQLLCSLAVLAAPAPAPLSLDEALAELDRASPSLEQARRRAEESSASARRAAAAALPSLTATGSYARNSDEAIAPLGTVLGPLVPPGGPRPRDLVIQPLEAFAGAASLRVPLLAAEAWAEASAARSAARASARSAEARRRQLRTALVQSAWIARAGEETTAAWERAAESARALAASAARAVEAGTGTPLARLRAETEAVRREGELVEARAELERARLAIGVLLGRAEPVAIALPADPAPLEGAAPQAPAAPDVAGALSRPELAAARSAREAAERRRRSARARWIPILAASGSAFASDVPYPTGERQGWRATVDLSLPIWDGGLREARIREAGAALGRAEAALAEEELGLRQELADAARGLDVARERLRLAEGQRRLAAEADATARRGEAAGVASALEVLDASDRLAQAEVALARARARAGVAAAALDHAAGR